MEESTHMESASGDSRPTVSVVILTFNGLDLLKRCLPSVLATRWPNLEIVVADNGSTDGTLAWLRAHTPQVVAVDHGSNLLFCAGNNRAVEQASGEFVVLLNNDVEVDPDWLAPLINRLTTDPSIGAVQPKLLQFDDRGRFEYAGGAGGHLDRFGYPFTRGRLFFDMEDDRGQYDADEPIFWASGAALCMRRSVYLDLGGLDERFEMHMEEIDLCWRLQRRGLGIRMVPSSRVFHIGGASLPHGSPRKTYLNYRNNILTLYKNLTPREWLRVFPGRVLLDFVGALRLLVLFKPGEAFAIFRAYGSAHFMKGSMSDERPAKGNPPVLPSYRHSVVVDYFLRGRKRFSDLPAGGFTASPEPVD